ncbi:MAG TPA: hypothetical protein VIV61_04080 [Candidatus Ozemobacteraceae bacterium]
MGNHLLGCQPASQFYFPTLKFGRSACHHSAKGYLPGANDKKATCQKHQDGNAESGHGDKKP